MPEAFSCPNTTAQFDTYLVSNWYRGGEIFSLCKHTLLTPYGIILCTYEKKIFLEASSPYLLFVKFIIFVYSVFAQRVTGKII